MAFLHELNSLKIIYHMFTTEHKIPLVFLEYTETDRTLNRRVEIKILKK
jgi:hypothetical protein